MFFISRGWGLVALFALFLPLGALIALIDTHKGWAFLLSGLSLIGGGIACWILGRRWNTPFTEHTMYFVPLQYWALLYVPFGLLLTLGGLANLLGKGGR
jgi:hypothetical protein